MLRAHRQAWAWQDEWFGLTMDDIRQIERQTQEALKKTMGGGGASDDDEDEDGEEEENNGACELRFGGTRHIRLLHLRTGRTLPLPDFLEIHFLKRKRDVDL